MVESSPNWKKILWEREKLLLRSNFSFSRSVVKRLALETRKNEGLFWKRLNVCKMMESVPEAMETIVGKMRQCLFQHFLVFPTIYFFCIFKYCYVFTIALSPARWHSHT